MDVLMPQLGETVKEGKISAWFKSAGDAIEAGDNLFEIETDKVSMEVQATESGPLTEIRVPVGAVAPVGAIVAVIGTGSGRVDAAPAAAPAPPRREAPARAAPAPQAPPSASLEERGFAPFNEVFTPSRNFGKAALGDVRMTPLARRLIAQNGLDAATMAARARIHGASRVAARDVHAALSEAPAAQRETYAPAITGPRTVEPMNRMRQMTARHLAGAWRTIPHVFQTIEIDFSAVSRTRGARKQAFRERHGAGLTFLPFIARAAAIAIAAYPRVNASVDGDKLLVAREINIGFAVDLAHEGLVVPVVKHADRLTVPGLAIAISELADKARKGKLAPGDLEGGTYSISNNGTFGTLFTAPLINAPQVAILSTDRIAKRPVAIETEYGDAIVARPVGVVAQSFDHRAIDGAYSAAFLQKLKSVIETHDWDLELS